MAGRGRRPAADLSELRGRMRAAMERAGISSDLMAERLEPWMGERTGAAIRKWLLGTSEIPAKAVVPWAAITGARVDWLMSGEGEAEALSINFLGEGAADELTPRRLARDWPQMTDAQQALIRSALMVIHEASPSAMDESMDVSAEEPGAR